MFWVDKLIKQLDGQTLQIVNDSKTPSGRAHVGALRGVIIHDTIFRALKEYGFEAHYTFGVDDYDPLDELPYSKYEQFQEFLGKPLCEVPAPDNTTSDMADYYISEFFSVFKELGVQVTTYRLRDIYRSGQFDATIDRILTKADQVRDIYRTVSGSIRPPTWLPIQMICEKCGRIGTTEAYAYDGQEVSYHCRPDMVTWATGCGYKGKGSPFSGRSKLPWKLEWVAKWANQGITIEGAGKDHNSKGGSRDVAVACLKQLFGKPAPLNIPYEFFLVEGAKMSSSRGIGVAARDMADFLPPEVLRFLMLRSQPNRPINFSPSEDAIVKLFNEFDRCQAAISKPNANPEILRIRRFSQVSRDPNAADIEYTIPGMQLIQALVQLPHLDVVTEVQRRNPRPFTDLEFKHLHRRIAAVKYWLEHYAEDSERLELQQELPDVASNLSDLQKDFLQRLSVALKDAVWEGNALQNLIFATSKLVPIPQPAAFSAIYIVLFGRVQGPRAGPLFSYLDRDFLMTRFNLKE